jgi:hypothetical protein
LTFFTCPKFSVHGAFGLSDLLLWFFCATVCCWYSNHLDAWLVMYAICHRSPLNHTGESDLEQLNLIVKVLGPYTHDQFAVDSIILCDCCFEFARACLAPSPRRSPSPSARPRYQCRCGV